jgi:colanic acid/amylovoran biosynthesis glycosyltransferase
MRIAVFTNMFPSMVNTYFARDMRALIEAGLDIDIFAIYPLAAQYWVYVPDVLGEHVLPRDRVHHATVRAALQAVRPAGLLGFPGFLRDAAAIGASGVRCGPVPLAKTVYVVPLAWAWAREFGQRYDHVLAYWGGYPGTCAYFFHRFAGRPIPFSMYLHARTDLYGPQPLLRRKLLYADSIISISHYNRRFLQQEYGDIFGRIDHKIHINYRGVDFQEFPYRPLGRLPHRVLAVGRLDKEKGYDYLLRAAAALWRRGVDLELEFVGDGPERAALPRLATRLGIRDRVTFRGWLRFDEVREAMHRATILANPSREDALPTVIEEAMALGLPVIASRVQGTPELLDQGRCGVLVPPHDVGALADGIGSLLAAPALRVRYAELARQHAERILDLWRNGARLADHLRATHRAPPLGVPARATQPPRRRPLVVELLGPGGAGKSTLLACLAAQDRSLRVDMGVWTLPRSLLMVGAIQRLSTILRLCGAARAVLWDESKYLIKLRALDHQLRLQRVTRHPVVVLDEGPVFALSWLHADGHRSATNGGLASWWPDAFGQWADAVDLVIYLDAPNSVLTQRIRGRARGHPFKARPDAEIFAFLERYRSAHGRVLAELRARHGPAVISYRTDRQAIPDIAAEVLAVFARERDA